MSAARSSCWLDYFRHKFVAFGLSCPLEAKKHLRTRPNWFFDTQTRHSMKNRSEKNSNGRSYLIRVMKYNVRECSRCFHFRLLYCLRCREKRSVLFSTLTSRHRCRASTVRSYSSCAKSTTVTYDQKCEIVKQLSGNSCVVCEISIENK